jgi:hypothetical protein
MPISFKGKEEGFKTPETFLLKLANCETFMARKHEYEFKNMEELKKFPDPYFKNVSVFETIYPERHNLYFLASDDILPFSKEWKHWIH